MKFMIVVTHSLLNIGGDNSYTYTASSGDGRNEVISGLISLIGTELDGEYLPLLQLKTLPVCQILSLLQTT